MQDVSDTALPPAFEGACEETLFKNRKLSLHCLNTVHYEPFEFIQKGAGLCNLWQRKMSNHINLLSDSVFEYKCKKSFSSIVQT